jgi:hypothetical protein
MEIEDNMEHLSLSQSKSNMKQFNKQLQAFHAGWSNDWVWGDRQGSCRQREVWVFLPGHRAGAWQLWVDENDMPAKSEHWASPGALRRFALLESISGGQCANGSVGAKRVFWRACVCVCVCVRVRVRVCAVRARVCVRVRVCAHARAVHGGELFCFYLIHILMGKKMFESPKNLQTLQAGSVSILCIIESCYQRKYSSEESKTSV